VEGRREGIVETEASRAVDWRKKMKKKERREGEEGREGHGKWSVRKRQSSVSGGSDGCG
jgi:hypothetical protein